jgi:transposase
MPAGRPLELTRDHITQAVALLPRTMYVETVADLIGVHRVTFRRWLNAGAKEQGRRERGKGADPARDLHCEFCIAVKKAMATAERGALEQIQAASVESWQAAAWMLERRYPEKWATNRGELKALAKEIAALGKQGAGSGVPRTTPKVRAATAKAGA